MGRISSDPNFIINNYLFHLIKPKTKVGIPLISFQKQIGQKLRFFDMGPKNFGSITKSFSSNCLLIILFNNNNKLTLMLLLFVSEKISVVYLYYNIIGMQEKACNYNPQGNINLKVKVFFLAVTTLTLIHMIFLDFYTLN